MRHIIGIISSLAVGLLLAAAGLYFDVKTLTLMGIFLFAFAAVLWLWDWGRAAQRANDPTTRERRRKLIDEGRLLAARYSQGGSGDQSFRQFLERTKTYAALRPYLSGRYLKKLNAPRRVYLQQEGARYEPLVEWFLDDLDRLEREWGMD